MCCQNSYYYIDKLIKFNMMRILLSKICSAYIV